jgi:hypothetical protein
MILVGVSGRSGHGKDAIASHLVARHGFQRLGWADALKDEVRTRLRETVKRITILDEVTGALNGIPDELRWHASHDHDASWWDMRLHYAIYENRSPIVRSLLQEFGTDVRRVDQADYWLDAWQRLAVERFGPLDTRRLVIPDTRFPNEAQRVRDLGGRLLRVTRPGYESVAARGHESESALDGWTDWDGDLTNDGSLADLTAKVDTWWELFGSIETSELIATVTWHRPPRTAEERAWLDQELAMKLCEASKGWAFPPSTEIRRPGRV